MESSGCICLSDCSSVFRVYEIDICQLNRGSVFSSRTSICIKYIYYGVVMYFFIPSV